MSKGLSLCEWSTLWVYFFSWICYLDNCVILCPYVTVLLCPYFCLSVCRFILVSTYMWWQFAGSYRLVGRPCESVSRSTRHPVDLLALKSGHQPWPLYGVGASIAELTFIVVTPGEDLTLISAGDTVKRSGGYWDDTFTLQCRHLWKIIKFKIKMKTVAALFKHICPISPFFA